MNSVHNFLFYPRLALTNMKKNASIYRPYLLAGGLLAGLLYVLDSVGVMVEKSQMAGKDIMQVIVEICGNICMLFVFLILFYINSFVMKRRKKEFGLFCVLGMEKKHMRQAFPASVSCPPQYSLPFPPAQAYMLGRRIY